MADYDAVVVGAGLGGLSAATFLSKAGKKVLLLERHRVPGGYASSFKRGRFEFEISLHELSGLGSADNRGPLWKLFEETGISRKVEFIHIPEFFRSVFPDVDITIPIGRENFEAEMARHFPAEAENFKQFSAIMFDFADQALKANRVGMKKVASEPESFPVLMQHFGKSLSQVLDPIVKDEKARAVLGQIWGYYCLPPSQLSFLIYALGTVSYLRFGPAHIKGTSQALSQAFMDVIEENGSDVWLNNGAERILATGGKVYGVVTDSGEKIDCPYVVCNANPLTTCLDLIGRDEVPSWYLRRLGAGTGGASTFNVYLGLDCTYKEVGLANHETFVNTGYDLDGHYELMRAGIDVEPAEAAVTAYNAVDPDFSPPGTAAVVITLIARPDSWLKLDPALYDETKTRVADRVIGLAERIAPDIRKHIEVVEVATPITNARYTGNPSGSIIGFNETFTGTGLVRMPARGPLDGLYFSSAWVNIGGGYEPSIYSGYLATKEVLEDMEGGRDTRVMEKVKKQVEEQAGEASEVAADALEPMKKVLASIHPRRVPLVVSDIIEETATTSRGRTAAVQGGPVCEPLRRDRWRDDVAPVQHLLGARQAVLRPHRTPHAPGVCIRVPPPQGEARRQVRIDGAVRRLLLRAAERYSLACLPGGRKRHHAVRIHGERGSRESPSAGRPPDLRQPQPVRHHLQGRAGRPRRAEPQHQGRFRHQRAAGRLDGPMRFPERGDDLRPHRDCRGQDVLRLRAAAHVSALR
jgi:phytoene dehydrogenase-like protein